MRKPTRYTLPPSARALGFTEAWFELGIIDKPLLDILCVRWHESGDHSPEHYRWRAFTLFVLRVSPLSAELATALYDLGAAEVDPAMGGSMMRSVIQMPNCPVELLQRAFASDHPHLVRIARRRLNLPEPSA